MTAPHDAPVVPGYRVRRWLRDGAMGALWEARDRQGRRVALKVPHRTSPFGGERMRRHYRREAATVLHLEHPNLVHGYEIGEAEDGRPFLALEYLEGETLLGRLRRRVLSEREAVAVGIGVARALEHMHARDIVHRDVKPENVMLLADGGLKLVDLGLAEESGQDAPGCGTPGFASPEMIRGGEVGPASDLFSLGVTLATAVLGRNVFWAKTSQETLKKTLREPLVLPAEVRGAPLSEGFRRVVERLVRKAPGERYGSAAELRLDLEALEEGDRPFGIWVARSRRVLRRRALVGGAAGLLVLAVAVGILATRGGPPAPEAPPKANAPPVTPAETEPKPDVEVEAALLFTERNPDAIREARRLLGAVRDRPMPPDQRERLEAALRDVEARAARRARNALASRRAKARALRATGDLDGMERVLTTWPEELAGTPEALEAKNLAETWRRESEAPGRDLLKASEADLARWADAEDPPSTEAVDGWLERVAALRAGPSLPRAQRSALADLADRLEGWRRRAAATEHEAGARRALEAALRSEPAACVTALQALAEDEATRGTEAATLARAVLARVAKFDLALEGALDAVRGKPWAGVVDGALFVGRCPADLQPRRAFAPERTAWDDAAPWGRDTSALLAYADRPSDVTVWLWLQGLGPVPPPAKDPDDPVSLLWTAAGPEGPNPGTSSGPGPFWRGLRTRLALALRPPDQAASAPSGLEDPILAAWASAIHGPRRRASAGAPNEHLEAARRAYLTDDLIGAWTALRRAVRTAPGDGEAALLSSMVLEALPTAVSPRPLRLWALTEARRAWDLDPSLAAAPRTVARLALRVWADAPAGLRERLAPLACVACEEVLRQGEDDPDVILFLAARREIQGDPSEALRLLREANRRWPSSPRILLPLARVEAEHGDPEAAKKALEEVKAHPTAELPAWAKALLERLDR